MMFNNKFNENGTIHFDEKEWVCTDPDTMQFCRIIDDVTFEYIQLKEDLVDLYYQLMGLGKNFITAIDGKTRPSDWYQDEICVNDYDADQIGDYLSPYGEILDGVDNDRDRNQLIAECIFETDCIMGCND